MADPKGWQTVLGRVPPITLETSLRAYDAVQLASSLLASETLQATGLPALIFLAADDRLISAAQVEGLITDNPNDHPE